MGRQKVFLVFLVVLVTCGCGADNLGDYPCPRWATEQCSTCSYRRASDMESNATIILQPGEEAQLSVYGRVYLDAPKNVRVYDKNEQEINLSSTILSVGVYHLLQVDPSILGTVTFVKIDTGAEADLVLVACASNNRE